VSAAHNCGFDSRVAAQARQLDRQQAACACLGPVEMAVDSVNTTSLCGSGVSCCMSCCCCTAVVVLPHRPVCAAGGVQAVGGRCGACAAAR
jgi:hypothetical protein